MILFYVLIHPAENPVGDLDIISVLHQHVAIAVEAKLRELQHASVSTRRLQLLHEGLATGEGAGPQRRRAWGTAKMIAEDHDRWDLRQRFDLRRRHGTACGAGLDRNDAIYS